ncbi:UPF0182 family protein [Acidipropionibacterium thoenii]|uniref:UPF0182 family membrane protein n=1 Tax=Acidipropionibacterium thoenii TaxID=1751 RepID=UPI000A02D958|nr:UPF0182 family protein [Acidipropionibacterium thoenii]
MSASRPFPRRVPPRLPSRPRRGVLIAIVVVIGLVIVWSIASTITTDLLWFTAIGYRRVYLIRLLAGVALFLAGMLLVGGGVAVNMMIALRLAGGARADRKVGSVSYQGFMVSHRRAVILTPAFFVGLLGGSSCAAQAATMLAWWNRTPTGTKDPYFGLDTSFYLFSYPWLHFLTNLLISVVVLSLLSALAVHLAVGAVTVTVPAVLTPGGTARARRQRSRLLTAGARAHLSVLVAIGLVLVGLSSLLGRYGLSVAQSPLFTGIGYTADHYRTTAKIIVAVISFLVALLFLANARLRHWGVPSVGIVLMLIATVIVQGIYPAFMQRFSVTPDAPDKERPYIANNIAATRSAFGIAGTTVSDYAASTTASAGQLKSDAEAVPSIRLMDPAVIGPTFEQLQQVRGFYSFPSTLDVDRYRIDGSMTDAVVAAREIDLSGLTDKSWNNVHTVYTHGYGLVAAYGNRRQASGEPEWLARDLPTVGKLTATQSRIYFGERASQYVVVGSAPGTAPVELDTPGGGKADSGGESKTTYSGKGGVSIGNFLVRAMYATKFADINLMLSDRVSAQSKILYDRTPLERVTEVAPWLKVDSDPLPTLVDGRLVWIVDGYTTSSNYPNSTRVDLRQASNDSTSQQRQSQPDQQINYIRNSVKAVVDAYDGTVQLYAWDSSDPILKTWQKVYPGTVKPRSAMSAELLAHVRYPQDMFKVQRQILGRYHTTDPDTWYQRNDLWQTPADPVRASAGSQPPYYLTIRWPNETNPVFRITTVMVPYKRENLAAYISVGSDATKSDYGRIRVLRMSSSTQIDGPNQTASAITSDTTVSAKLLPYQNKGSASASLGNLLTLPVGGGLLYVQPIYAQRQTGSGGYPVLRFVAVRFGTHVGIGSTLQESLDQVFGGDAGAQTAETQDSNGSGQSQGSTAATTRQARELLSQAQSAFTAADKALQNGDLAEYQKQVDRAQDLVSQALKQVR